jgi:hypothetical protein
MFRLGSHIKTFVPGARGRAIFDIVYLAAGEPSRFAREVGAAGMTAPTLWA